MDGRGCDWVQCAFLFSLSVLSNNQPEADEGKEGTRWECGEEVRLIATNDSPKLSSPSEPTSMNRNELSPPEKDSVTRGRGLDSDEGAC